MKKYILFLLIAFSCTFSVFAQEQDLENTTSTEEIKSDSGSYAIGIGLSGLGIEPIFQYRKNNLEMQGSIAFSNLGLFMDGTNFNTFTPKFDIGYFVTNKDINLTISTGLSNIVLFGAGQLDSSGYDFACADMISLYLKVSEQIENFELGGKFLFPIYAFGYESSTGFMNEFLAAEPAGIGVTLFSFTLEAKIFIN
ncbi:MAG: hypothetical protein MJ174_02445 [Treponema sp.]|nr:hypothetical protein [Treponema sp.]